MDKKKSLPIEYFLVFIETLAEYIHGIMTKLVVLKGTL